MKKVLALMAILTAAAFASGQAPAPAAKQRIPEISADLGVCSAEFHVTDTAAKPLYDAKVKARIRYGIMGKRKLDLEAGTNSDGLVRFVHLPDDLKHPIWFNISYQGQSTSISVDPATDCAVKKDVSLKTAQ